MATLAKIDAAQKDFTAAAVAVATGKKFSEDQSTSLATTMAFWAFFSIFPLLLAFITVLGWVLPASSKQSVLTHVAQMFPVLDPSTVKSLGGSIWALALGVVSALWSGLAVVRTTQTAFSAVWGVPQKRREGLVRQVLRSLLVLLTIGVGFVLATLVSGFVTSASRGANIGVIGQLGGYVLAAALDVALLLAAFRILTHHPVTIRDILPGALLSGLVFFILQQASALIISRYLKNAQSTYGHFATVITILWWFYISSIVTMLGAQLNVVLKERLYPRSLRKGRPTDADRRIAETQTEAPRFRIEAATAAPASTAASQRPS
jgi:YihY family inner membrane protein